MHPNLYVVSNTGSPSLALVALNIDPRICNIDMTMCRHVRAAAPRQLGAAPTGNVFACRDFQGLQEAVLLVSLAHTSQQRVRSRASAAVKVSLSCGRCSVRREALLP